MKGATTLEERRKQAEKNVEAALEYLRGIDKCERCIAVETILRRDLRKED